MSRAQMLKVMGSGLAVALAAGSLRLDALGASAANLPNLVLIILDGARREYFNVPNIPHLRSLVTQGTQYTNAFAGILESETPSGHTTISTGSEPRTTGIPSFWWANSANVEIDLFDPTKIRAHDMEKIISQSGVPTLAGAVHGKYSKASVVALSGSKYYAADAIGGPDADVIMYFQGTAAGRFVPTYIPGHAPVSGVLSSPGLTTSNKSMPLGTENHLVMKLAVDTFNRTKQQVTLINLPEFDWPLGHVNGGVLDSKGIKTLMQGFDSDLAMLQDAYRKAGMLKNTLFVLAADHGMMPLIHKVPKEAITAAVSRAGATIVSDAYTSGAYLWLKDETRATAAGANIANLHHPYIQSVYVRLRTTKGYVYKRVTSSKLLRTGSVEVANQYLLRSFNGPNAPDLVVVFTEGVGSEPGGQKNWKADHGGTSWESQQIPLILSGPGIRSGHVSTNPARLIDIAPTALQAMGIPQKGMQGIPLADALKSPPSWAVQRQKAVSSQLAPLVASLQRESQMELKAGL